MRGLEFVIFGKRKSELYINKPFMLLIRPGKKHKMIVEKLSKMPVNYPALKESLLSYSSNPIPLK